MYFSSQIMPKKVNVSRQNCCLRHNTVNRANGLKISKKDQMQEKQHNLQQTVKLAAIKHTGAEGNEKKRKFMSNFKKIMYNV